MTQPSEKITNADACDRYRKASDLGEIGFDIDALRQLGWECGPLEPSEPQAPPRYQDFRRYVVPSSLLICGFLALGYYAPEIAAEVGSWGLLP